MTETARQADHTALPLVGKGLSRSFSTPAGEIRALDGVDVHLKQGELLIVRGPSGSGKTTLLNLLGTLDRPTSGSLLLFGKDLSQKKDNALAACRAKQYGFVFQTFGLIPVLSARENIEVPLRIAKTSVKERNLRVDEALEQVGLAKHAEQRPYELSGGQQQRVGVARALVTKPSILIADEPTGQLDSKTAFSIMRLITSLVREQQLSAVISTHDPEFMSLADRLLTLQDGKVIETGSPSS